MIDDIVVVIIIVIWGGDDRPSPSASISENSALAGTFLDEVP